MNAGGFFPTDNGPTRFLLEPFLREVKEQAHLNRVMFGSDQRRWREAIVLAIDRVNRLDFLTVEGKAGRLLRQRGDIPRTHR